MGVCCIHDAQVHGRDRPSLPSVSFWDWRTKAFKYFHSVCSNQCWQRDEQGTKEAQWGPHSSFRGESLGLGHPVEFARQTS